MLKNLVLVNNPPPRVNVPLNELNDNFLSFSSSVNNKATADYLSELHKINPDQSRPKFNFKPILQIDVLRAIRRIKTDATGSDQIPISLVKRILFAILPAVTAIYNKSLKTGIFPSMEVCPHLTFK